MDFDICSRLADARKKAGLSQKVVCTDLNIPNVQTLSNYENNKNDPAIDRLCDLIDYYGVSADWLLFGTENRTEKYSSNREKVETLIKLLDALDIQIEPEYGFNSMETGRYIINLSHSPRSGFLELFDAVYNYRMLVSKGNLPAKEYQLLLQYKVADVSSKTNDFAPCDPPHYPSEEEQLEQYLDEYETPF